MAHVTADRVLQACTPVSTTSFFLGTAVTGFIGIASIPAIANNDTMYYSAWGVDASGIPTGEWENGLGTYVSGISSLARTIILSSSTGSAITFTAGTVWLSVSLVAGRVFQGDRYNKLVLEPSSTFSASLNIPDASSSFTPTGATDGDVWRDTSDHVWMKSGTSTTQLTSKIVTTASTVSTTSTTLQNITGFSITAETSNATYEVDAFLTFQTAATTTGFTVGFNSSAGSTVNLEVIVPIVSTAANTARSIIFPSGTSTTSGSVVGTGVTAINSNHTARVSGIVTLASITDAFWLQYASEVSASQVSLMAGSRMVYRRIA